MTRPSRPCAARLCPASPAKQPVVLALSGGGADGAFGAGLLAGWSARGTRPQFTLVTGASAGALIAPFAFLGPAYDETLRSVFATGEMANLLQSEGLAGLFGTGLYKTQPLRDLIARHVDGSMLAAIAREHRAGRRLYIVTTNLDAQRTAILWDMGVIADSGDPGALDLFRNVLTASASIPGVFSPMLIEVEADGRRSAEMHVDGGVTTNVLILPEALLVSGTPVFPPDARPKVYVVMNSKLAPDFEVVKASTLQIVRRWFLLKHPCAPIRAIRCLRPTVLPKLPELGLQLASINSDYPKSDTIGFDLAYMQQLFDYGYQRGRAGILGDRRRRNSNCRCPHGHVSHSGSKSDSNPPPIKSERAIMSCRKVRPASRPINVTSPVWRRGGAREPNALFPAPLLPIITMRGLKMSASGQRPTYEVSNFAQTPLSRRAYVTAIAGPPGVKKHENCADRAAYGERAAAALWRHRANCLLSHGGTGPTWSRGDPVRECGLHHRRRAGGLRVHGIAPRPQCPRPDPLLHADARQSTPARGRIRHFAFPYRPVSFSAVSPRWPIAR